AALRLISFIPLPSAALFISNPLPSSSIRRKNFEFLSRRLTCICLAIECFAALIMASLKTDNNSYLCAMARWRSAAPSSISNMISMSWRLSISTAKLFILSIVFNIVSFFGSMLQTMSYMACTIRLLVSLICAMYSFVRSLSVSTFVFASSLEILMLLSELLISSVRLVAILVLILSVALTFCMRCLSTQNKRATNTKTARPRNHHVFQNGGFTFMTSFVTL